MAVEGVGEGVQAEAGHLSAQEATGLRPLLKAMTEPHCPRGPRPSQPSTAADQAASEGRPPGPGWLSGTQTSRAWTRHSERGFHLGPLTLPARRRLRSAGRSFKARRTERNTGVWRSGRQLFVQLFKRKGESLQGNAPWPLAQSFRRRTPHGPVAGDLGPAHPAQAREEEPRAAQVWPPEEEAGDWPPGLCPTIVLAWGTFLPRGPSGTEAQSAFWPLPGTPASPAHSNRVSPHKVRAGCVGVHIFDHLPP